MRDSRRTKMNYDDGATPAVSGWHTMVLAIFSGREALAQSSSMGLPRPASMVDREWGDMPLRKVSSMTSGCHDWAAQSQ